MGNPAAGRPFSKAVKSKSAHGMVPTAPVEITVRGIRVELLRKEIKNLHLRVYPPDGRVRISVPRQFPINSVVDVIEQRIGWIQAQQSRVSGHFLRLSYVDGETHWFSGRPLRLRVTECAEKGKIDIPEPGVIELCIKRASSEEERRRLFESWYREQLRLRAAPLFEEWADVLGVQVGEWRIRKMSTRWGSCNVGEKRIWLSLELAKKSDDCLEYVVVHELAHLIEPGHGPRFVAQMDRTISNWRELKRKLNSHS